jgi:hypothetical protein
MMSLAKPQARDDQLLIRYLIGSLTEAEAERLDELSVSDDEVAADLRDVEHDLVDAYVRGALSGDTLHRFETQYLSLPAARAKVTVARALHQHEERRAAAPQFNAGERSAGKAGPRFQWGLAAAAVLLLGAAGYLFADNARLRRQLIEFRAGLEGRQQQLEQQLREERSAHADTARELERVRQTPAPRPILASFVLLPPTRGVGDIPTLSIPPGSGAVAFQVNLESSDFPAYRVDLRDVAIGQIVWRSAALQLSSLGGANSLAITLGAEVLKPRTYLMSVSGVPARGAVQPVGSYPFKVVLQ